MLALKKLLVNETHGILIARKTPWILHFSVNCIYV